jgi:rhamnulokinase
MTGRVFGAVDLGASGGRVMAGVVEPGCVTLHPVHRFSNKAENVAGHLRWNFTRLFGEVLVGLARLGRDFPDVESIGVDTWGVDYGLLDDDGRLIAEPIAYRDDRTGKAVDDVHSRISPRELFAINGLQVLPFNTLYQLEVEKRGPHWPRARTIVLLPDLLSYWLTGELATETTNASTTGLLDVRTGQWSQDLLERLDIRPDRFPPLQTPGVVRGRLRADVRARTELSPNVVVTTVASHDTASAVVGVPATTRDFVYVASGTWSLVGFELDQPVLTPEARVANFTNERGVDDRIRFLRNVGGLWLIQESLRTWSERGEHHDLPQLVEAARKLPPGPTVDVDDPRFLAPGDMPTRIAAACAARVPMSAAATVRCVVDSLAATYARTVERARSLCRRTADVVHIVGGGSQNSLLCQSTADAVGLPVVAGPIEATAFGNVLVQARAHGAVPATLDALRRHIASTELRTYSPS